MGDIDFRGARSRLASELKIFIFELDQSRVDSDTVDFVKERAEGLIAEVEGAIDERGLSRVETDLGRLQVVVHQALKREGDRRAEQSEAVSRSTEGGGEHG